jgi:hypothetical protein
MKRKPVFVGGTYLLHEYETSSLYGGLQAELFFGFNMDGTIVECGGIRQADF